MFFCQARLKSSGFQNQSIIRQLMWAVVGLSGKGKTNTLLQMIGVVNENDDEQPRYMALVEQFG